jgi:hypothetical protein
MENPVADDVTFVQMCKDVKGILQEKPRSPFLLHHNQSDHLRPVGNCFHQIERETSFTSLVDLGEECLKDLLFQAFAFIYRGDHLLDLVDSTLFVVLVNALEI